MPAACRGRSGRASRGGLGRTRAQVRRRCRSGAAPGCGRGRACSARAISSSTRSSSATPGTSTCRRRGGSRSGRPVVFNPLVSLADTLVGDRGRFRPRSPAARALATIDRRAFGAADLVVADTAAQAPFFRSLGARHVEVCFVGAEERLFMPGWARPAEAEFTALFVGKLIPAPRARDDPRRGAARARASLPCRRLGPARAAARPTGRRTSSTCPGSTTSSCPASCAARPARSASSERRRRRRG